MHNYAISMLTRSSPAFDSLRPTVFGEKCRFSQIVNRGFSWRVRTLPLRPFSQGFRFEFFRKNVSSTYTITHWRGRHKPPTHYIRLYSMKKGSVAASVRSFRSEPRLTYVVQRTEATKSLLLRRTAAASMKRFSFLLFSVVGNVVFNLVRSSLSLKKAFLCLKILAWHLKKRKDEKIFSCVKKVHCHFPYNYFHK